MAEDKLYRLIHFNTRFLAEPIRFILEFKQIPFEDIRISQQDWKTMKDTVPWKQLPYLELNDGRIISQSSCIARYLAIKHGLAGKDEFESAKCSEISECFRDIRSYWRLFFLEKDQEKQDLNKKNFVNNVLPLFFEPMDKMVEQNGGFLVGNQITWVDLLAAISFGLLELTVDRNIMSDYPNLKDLKNKIFEHPNLQEYLSKRPRLGIADLRVVPMAKM